MVYTNFALVLLLIVAVCVVYALSGAPLAQQQQQQLVRDNVIHKLHAFEVETSNMATTVQLVQFNANRLVDVSLCCRNGQSDSIQCTRDELIISATGLVQIPAQPVGITDCRLAWTQQK